MKTNGSKRKPGSADLRALGLRTAEGLVCAGRRGGGAARELKAAEAALEDVCKGGSLAGTPAGEWLRDNLHVLRRDAASAADELRRARGLRRTDSGGPVVCLAAEALVDACASEADEGRVIAFLEGFQRRLPLEERELALLPAALRRALILRLRREPGEAERVFRSLRWLEEAPLWKLAEKLSPVERILRQDPAGVYERMDEDSRRDYRLRTARLAEKKGCTEPEAAALALELARKENCHVGEFLFRRPLGEELPAGPFAAYLCYHLLLPAVLAAAFGAAAGPAAGLLVFLPLRDAVKYLFERIYTRCARPERLPRLDYSRGIPPESRTLAVSAELLTGAQEAAQAVRRLEEGWLANRDAGDGLCLGLLADLREGPEEVSPEDEAILAAAAGEIDRLCGLYGDRFCLLTRRRSYSARDRVWRPRERKRGAVMELTELLRGGESSLTLRAGSRECLEGIRFLIVLDADTRLNLGSAARLAGTLAHPLQAPVTDPATGRVLRGRALLQPKLGVSLTDAEQSEFARVFAGQGGLDPYGGLNSDVYQDLFREGSYAGKGILEVDAFRAALRGRFPPETLLSHDLLEGAFAGCAFVSDVELTDGFPSGLLSYFERQHRWIRGDWQTLPWLFPRVPTGDGTREKNPLSPLSRWKILDNLLRSLTPTAELAILLCCGFFPGRAFVLTLSAVLLCLVLRIASDSPGRVPGLRRYRARALGAAAGDFRQLLWLVLLLPYRAWIHGSAVCLALYRSLVSRRNLLRWVTAAEGDKRGRGGPGLYYRRMWPCWVLGLALALCPRIPLRALGLLWLLVPALSFAAGRPTGTRGKPGEEERLFLLHCAADMLRYFEEQVTPERRWLPPDNLQETPVRVTAERTSPTNVGLYLLSCLAAADLGLWTHEKAWDRIGLTLRTLLALPKCRGHLYNWYDIRSGQPLDPAFVSTVDSANLLASLIILARAAREAGETAAAELLRALSEPMDLGFLFDEARGLLRIGWDGAADRPVGGCYDLLESEARIASYLAIARGSVPWKHWRRLGRTLADAAGMSGLASWTGTMFEYMLPEAILPGPRGSLLAESREFCLRVQKRRAPGGVWGMSESAFAETDSGGSYAYKAHGVQGLALKRGMDREAVVAPYASFLALEEDRRGAVRNLLRLRALGAEGTYGFIEALDFTPQRLEGAAFRPVRCYMAHHLGMSILAVDNCLSEGIMQRRMMAEPAVAACRELLEERTPVGRRIRPVQDAAVPLRPERGSREGFLLEKEGFDPRHPALFPLAGGGYSLVLSELGGGRAFWTPPGCRETSARVAPHGGVLFFAAPEAGLVSLQPLPELAEGQPFRSLWDGACLCRDTAAEGLEFRIRSSAAPAGGEVHEVTVRNPGRSPRRLTLALYLEPLLCRERDYASHPAFSRLSLESRLEEGALIILRRPGGSALPCALALACSEAFSADTDKALIFGRGSILGMPAAIRRPGGGVRAASEPCAFLRTELRLRPGQKKTLRFALAAAGDGEAAGASAKRLLRREGGEGEPFLRSLKLLEGGPGPEEAAGLLTELLADTPEKLRRRRGADPSALWRWGISGDLPTAACAAEEGEKLLRAWAFLRALGVPFDLAILTEDAGVYGQPQREALRALAAGLGLGDAENKPGGFRFVGGSREDRDALFAAADAAGLKKPLRLPPSAEAGRSFYPTDAETAAPRRGEFTPEGYLMRTEKGLGRRAWSLVLTNGSLGWLATDGGSGSLWLDNARERRLTPWDNDPLAVDGPETLQLLRGGRTLSLFAAPDEYPAEVLFGFGFIRWRRSMGGLETETVGFIPPGKNLRVLLVSLRGFREGDRLRWTLRPEKGAELWPAVSGKTLPEEETPGFLRVSCAAAEKLCLVLSPEKRTPLPPAEGEALLRETKAHWRRVTEACRAVTPSPALNALLNGWALYQTLACRMLGRASLYQSGGAYGFRDQLQDACALADAFPNLTRAHLLLCAAHQYAEGDVMHWWHPGGEGDRGVRTRCSDDLLWLPYACAVYAEKTGDTAVLEEKVPWLSSAPLGPEEPDRYEKPARQGSGSLLEHCLRALRQTEERGIGPHGLLLFGSGDWNDGMDRVGGESVWLTWFAALVFDRFGSLLGDKALRERAQRLGAAADAAWDKGQYLRGYYADGRPLGAARNLECSMDSLAQSFAVLSGFGDRERSRAAVCRAADLLLDRQLRLVRIFTPPFNGATEPGYIRSYLPGVRENGGQYTHAGLWLAAACLRCGETERGWRLLEAMLPFGRAEETYQLEPFVLPADVYANPDMPGRGGWSWYTGAAGWFLRVVLEELLGVRARGGELSVTPRLPESWNGFRLTLRAGGADWEIEAQRGEKGWEAQAKKTEKG